jgi:hypothetical protein
MKGYLQPAAARGSGRSRAHLRRRADAPRDRWAIANRLFRSPSARDGTLRRASRSQPGLGARSELSTPARIGRAAETWRAAAARSWIRSRVPSVPHDCRPNAAVLRPTRRGKIAECRSESCARLRRRGCGARVRPWRLARWTEYGEKTFHSHQASTRLGAASPVRRCGTGLVSRWIYSRPARCRPAQACHRAGVWRLWCPPAEPWESRGFHSVIIRLKVMMQFNSHSQLTLRLYVW